MILLVVLGMLSLFSLLAVTYVVVSSQSRIANMGMARSDYRGTPPDKLLDAAMRIALRGTKNSSSALWHHDLLGDLYGTQEPAQELRVRRNGWAGTTGNNPPPNPLSPGSDERPLLMAGRFLRIPVVDAQQGPASEGPSGLPPETDSWTGRVVTFLEGPLRGHSFRVIRYIGDTRTVTNAAGNADVDRQIQNYSIVIDLQGVADEIVHVAGVTRTITEWINLPPGPGLWLCYPNAGAGGAFQTGYRMLLNAAPFNFHGIGVGTNALAGPSGVSQDHTLAAPLDTTGISTFPVGLQPDYRELPTSGSVQGGNLAGDADESYDAADYNNYWLSHRKHGATDSSGVIPSFHRPALINYIANWKDPATFSNFEELAATVLRIDHATARPLSYIVENGTNSGTPNLVSHPSFTGSNPGDYVNGREPVLHVRYDNNWSDPANPMGVSAFNAWIAWLTQGPWDVDSDLDGIFDGIWVDPGMPLITSPEGKLLKVLVSYTIESLDSRLDLNAAGNLTQSDPAFTAQTSQQYAVGPNQTLPQGFGYGPGDISLRHLFPDDASYRAFMASRYGGANAHAGETGNDLRSQLDERERRAQNLHAQLPAFPLAVHGRVGIGLDRMGNPLMLNATPLTITGSTLSQITDEVYESRWMSGSYRDVPYTLTEFERVLRFNDWDRGNLPRRLDAFISKRHAITVRSRHLRLPTLSATNPAGGHSSSMFQLLQSIYAHRTGGSTLNFLMFAELFPFEFRRDQLLNLNRPLGNGVDDDGDGNIDEPEEILRNGVDDDGNGVVDELTPSERIPPTSPAAGFTSRQRSATIVGNTVQLSSVLEDYTFGLGTSSGNLDPDFEGLPPNAPERTYHYGQQSRQLLARNLYCLAMLILPDQIYLSNRPNATPLTGVQRARALAQWAVNVVDFRDADSAMTRFPYDPEPFTTSGSGQYWEPNTAAGHVVWGHENVDVVLTESLFTHDLRVKDTGRDPTGKTTTAMNNPDDDLDQYRMPEGSGFLELLCTRTTSQPADPSVPGVSSSLYTTNSAGNVGVNLSAITPPDQNGTRYPVFRIVMSEPHPPNRPTLFASSPLQIQSDPNARPWITYQLSRNVRSGLAWDQRNLTAAPPLNIERVVLFTDSITPTNQSIPDLPTGLTNAQVQGRTFTNFSNRQIVLAGGQYLVIGPRQVTYFGSRNLPGTNHRPNYHRIVLEDAFEPYQPSNTLGTGNVGPYRNWVTYYDGGNNRVTNRRVDSNGAPITRDCVTMVAAIAPMTWNPNPGGGSPPLLDSIGLNMSAPSVEQYYPAPTEQLDSNDTTPDPDTNAPGFGQMRGDAFYDYSGSGSSPFLPDEPFDSKIPSHRSLIARFWPYSDSQDAELPGPGTVTNWCTAFLQRLADPERPWHPVFNPYITVDWIPIDLTVFSGEENLPAAGPMHFTSRQKDGRMPDINAGGFGGNTGRTFLSYGVTNTDAHTSPAGAVPTAYFDRQLPLDTAPNVSGPPTYPRPTNGTPAQPHFVTLGYLNSPYRLLGQDTPQTIAGFVGAPADMPASLFWLDRPFTSPYELMMVPLSAPGQLFQEFSAPPPTGGSDPYANPQAVNDMTHLMNFFQPIAAAQQLSPATLLDLVETPSPWSDADDFLPPQLLTPSGSSLEARSIRKLFTSMFPPYNRVSTFTEPGRVNINDISDPDVWQGIMWSVLSPGQRTASLGAATPLWNELVRSRRGYASAGLDPEVPSQFAGVFKSAFEAGFVPQTRNSTLDRQAIATNNPVEVTLLRKSPTGNRALFSGTNPYNVKHPYAEYLPLTRLANLVTTRSNVFAVRVTVGFFEVDTSGNLGQEYLLDRGKAKRHTAFYIIDRSIPVGYRPGDDLNTGRCVLLRRIIE